MFWNRDDEFKDAWASARPRSYRKFAEWVNEYRSKLTPPDNRAQWHAYTVEPIARKLKLKVFKEPKQIGSTLFILHSDGKLQEISNSWED